VKAGLHRRGAASAGGEQRSQRSSPSRFGLRYLIAIAGAVLATPAAAQAATPTLTTNPAEEVGITTAKLSGTVDPEGASGAPNNTTWRLQYSPSGQESWQTANEGTITEPQSEEANSIEVEAIFGFSGELHPASEYEFRLQAEGPGGEAERAETAKPYPTFTTEAATAPTFHVNAPAEASYQRVQLSATIDPEGGNVNPIGGPVPITWFLEYAPASESLNSTIAGSGEIKESQAESTSPIEVEATPLGLRPDTEYQVRLVVFYAAESEVAHEQPTFQTLAVQPPSVSIDPITTFSATSAQLKGHVDPNSPEAEASTSPAEQ
jgi:hypothetical protein